MRFMELDVKSGLQVTIDKNAALTHGAVWWLG